MHPVRIERDSWNWDDIEAGSEEEEDPWAQQDREIDMDLIRFEQEEQDEVEEDPFRDPEETVEVREPLYIDGVEEVEEEVDSRAIAEAQQAAVLELVQELATASLPGVEAVLLVLPDAEDVGEDTASPSPRYLEMGAEVEVNEMDAEEQGEEDEESHSVDFDQTLVEIVPLPLEEKDKPLFSDNPIVEQPIPVQPPALDSKHVSLDPVLTTAIPDAMEVDTKRTLVEPSSTSSDVIVQRSEILENGVLTTIGSQGAQTWLDDTPSKSTVDFLSPSAVAEQSSITTIHDFNETYDDPPTPTLPSLPPLTIPLITISSAGYLDDGQYPDPDFLPLPENLSALLGNVDQSYSSDKWEMKEPWDESVIPKEPLSQMPTPPASPPMMPRSIPGSPRREKERGDRPAWSVRASDAPALGLSATSSAAASPVSPTLRAHSRLEDKEKEKGKEKEEEKKALDEPPEEERTHSIVEETQEPTQAEKISKEETKSVVPVSLPGAFPEPANLLPNPITPPPTTTSPTTTASNSDQVQASKATAVAAQLSARQRTPRSPIDIALAMQLRPGLGLGADPAWMVRFLMSMWGWFAIMISGSNEFR
ncbi:hypothetical protein BDQ12DRAFT_693817 [Crucibulum laeve]|uniref:Uncharacterized protein n=1 Tax=Crucibulum laeve TaxID=68775 RepID=A0A5C3LIB9_9AGAR|nr:hypothetical protein BDQ12DRAFT_693817 [Crucibulum laeve]